MPSRSEGLEVAYPDERSEIGIFWKKELPEEGFLKSAIVLKKKLSEEETFKGRIFQKKKFPEEGTLKSGIALNKKLSEKETFRRRNSLR